LRFAGWPLLLSGENSADAVKGIDFCCGLVWAKADDAGKPQGEAAFVAIGTLDIVESDLHDDERVDGANVAVVFDGVGEEIAG
jgi:hypothetical protein